MKDIINAVNRYRKKCLGLEPCSDLCNYDYFQGMDSLFCCPDLHNDDGYWYYVCKIGENKYHVKGFKYLSERTDD